MKTISSRASVVTGEVNKKNLSRAGDATSSPRDAASLERDRAQSTHRARFHGRSRWTT